MSKMIQMIALSMFTVNSTVNGAILHGDDREGADAAARYPLVSEADAARLEKDGLAKPYDGKLPGDSSNDGAGLTVDERSGVMVEGVNDAESSVEATTGLATRMTTAFEAPLENLAGAGGAERAVLTADDGKGEVAAEEEAPAGAAKTGAAKTASKK